MQINEIFSSLNGEADGFGTQGCVATFVRLQGCNLNCKWCDTPHARDRTGGEEMTVQEICAKCTCKHVTITGGEPLLQLEEVQQLTEALALKRGHLVTIETNGSIPIGSLRKWTPIGSVRFVVDYKLGSSGMTDAMQPDVFASLHNQDVLKFVVADMMDYRQAKELLDRWDAKKVLSPVIGTTSSVFDPALNWPAALAQEMIRDKLEGCYLSLQFHKILDLR